MRRSSEKYLALALALTMALGMAPAAAGAETPAAQEKWSYTQIVVPQYDAIGRFYDTDGLAKVKQGEKWGFIDKNGEIVIPIEYDEAGLFNNGLALVGKFIKTVEVRGEYNTETGQWDTVTKKLYQCGSIDKENKLTWFSYAEEGRVGEPVYVLEDAFSNWEHAFIGGYFFLDPREPDGKEWRYGLWKPDGEQLLLTYEKKYDELDYRPACPVTENVVVVGNMYYDPDDWKIFDLSQDPMHSWEIPCSVHVPYNQGLAPVGDWNDENVWVMNFINKAGETALKTQCIGYKSWKIVEGGANQIFDPDTGLAVMRDLQGKWGAIDKTGQTRIPFAYDEMLCVGCGLVPFKKDGKYGYLNVQGNEVIPAQYAVATPHSKVTGLALVSVDGSAYSFVDTEGRAVDIIDGVSVDSYLNENEDGTVESFDAADDILLIEEGDKYGFGVIRATTVDDPPTTPSAEPSATPTASPKPGGGGGRPAKPTPTPTPTPTPSPEPSSTPQPEVETKPASQVFADVEADSWYEEGVTFVTQEGLFQGVGNDCFAPQQNMTRAMLMTVLARLDGQETTGGDTWYAKGMDWAVNKGISDGTMAESSVTREQMITMLYRYVGQVEAKGDLSAFADAGNVSPWARDAMTWAVSQGILTGKGGTLLAPKGTATRAEVATILQRFAGKYK